MDVMRKITRAGTVKLIATIFVVNSVDFVLVRWPLVVFAFTMRIDQSQRNMPVGVVNLRKANSTNSVTTAPIIMRVFSRFLCDPAKVLITV